MMIRQIRETLRHYLRYGTALALYYLLELRLPKQRADKEGRVRRTNKRGQGT